MSEEPKRPRGARPIGRSAERRHDEFLRGVRDVFLVAAGEANAAVFREWLADSYRGACDVAVLAAPEDADTADAVRAALLPQLRDALRVFLGRRVHRT